ncbi:SIMPL domain-containing protein [Helicobacter burdigaliensis]|uniref:SIMPL domain-containing protein n=1 Tax=Helicobacter burdigaliensis TaxID=2315334 RepID=UPI000EF75649|nr:SIMPL domain-containing protein [Helicobacter burdigaliensis]
MGKLSAGILGICLLLSSMVFVYGIGNIALSFKEKERSVTVKGLSQREVNADVMILPIQFSKTNNDLNALYKDLEKDSKKLIDFLIKNGIEQNDITLKTPIVTDRLGSMYGENKEATYRYLGVGKVLLYTKQVDLGREILSKLSELGKEGMIFKINDYEVEYLYTKLNEIKPEMIEEATINAREVASKFAQDSKSTLGKIKNATQGQFSITNRDNNTPYVKSVRVVSTIEYYLKD